MIDQVKVVEIGADAIEAVLNDAPIQGLAYPPKLMHAVVAALGRHGYIIEDRYEDTRTDAAESPLVSPVATTPMAKDAPSSPVALRPDWGVGDTPISLPDLTPRTAPDWETSGDDA